MATRGFIAKKHIEAMSPYVGGKHIDTVARDYGLDPQRIVKLASNESPYGMSPKARDVAAEALTRHERYPDGNVHYCREAIAKVWGLTADWVITGNGTDEVLYLITRTLMEKDTSSVFCNHAFSVYNLSTLENAGTPIVVPTKDYAIDFEAMAAAIRPDTRLVFLTNPNNPTGLAFEEKDFRAFMAKVPGTCMVVLDEAYKDFMHERYQYDSTALVKEFANLIITRTFSKAFGMAGLRAGYGIAHPEFIELLNRIRPFFGMNGVAQAAAVEAIQDQAFVADVVKKNALERDRLQTFFKDNGIEFLPSEANFVLFRVKDAAAVVEELLKRGLIARAAANFGLPEWIRITVGLSEENDFFMKALLESIKAAG